MSHSAADSKKRLDRLRVFLRMLKQNAYPNYVSLQRAMEREKLDGTDFTRQTLYRDVEYLRKFGAKIGYDHVCQNGYYLENPNWSGFASFLEEDEMEAAMLGAQFAEQILPPSPLREKIRDSVDSLWTEHYLPDADVDVRWNSLVIQGLPVKIDSKVFQTIYLQWRSRHAVEITYTPMSRGKQQTATIEPHVLTYSNGIWYVRGKVVSPGKRNPGHKDFLTFALHRISSAKAKGDSFQGDLDMEEVKAINAGRIFDFPRHSGIRLKVRGRALRQAQETMPVKETDYKTEDSAEITLDEIEDYRVIQFTLLANGEAEILAPGELRQQTRQQAEAVAKCLK